MSLQRALERANEAIDDLISEDSVSPEETLEALADLVHNINDAIDAIQEEIS